LKSVFAFAIVLAASVSAQASFSGAWSGTGTLSNNAGQSAQCQSMVLNIAQTETQLTVTYKFICEDNSLETTQPMVAQIQGGKVISQGQQIGSITATDLMVGYQSTDGYDVSYTLHLAAANQLQYSQGVNKAGDGFNITGNFTK
jgi:hypothetical protein